MENEENKILKAAIIEDIKRVAKELNLTTELSYRIFYENSKHTHGEIMKHFGTWNNAKVCSGLPFKGANSARVAEEIFFNDIRRIAKKLNSKTLTTVNYNKYGKYNYLSFKKIYRWKEILRKAGLEPTKYGSDDENLLDDLRKAAAIYPGKKLVIRYYKPVGKYNFNTMIFRFGSWNKALKKAGLIAAQPIKFTKEELLEDLKRIAHLYPDSRITRKMYSSQGKYTVYYYDKEFGSFDNAVKKSGLKTKPPHFKKEEMIKDMQRVAKAEKNKKFRWSLYKKKGKMNPYTIVHTFGKWSIAIKAAKLK